MCVLLGFESHGGPLVRRFKKHLPEPKLGRSWLDRLNSQTMCGGWRPTDRNVLWAVSPQSTDERRCPQKH